MLLRCLSKQMYVCDTEVSVKQPLLEAVGEWNKKQMRGKIVKVGEWQ